MKSFAPSSNNFSSLKVFFKKPIFNTTLIILLFVGVGLFYFKSKLTSELIFIAPLFILWLQNKINLFIKDWLPFLLIWLIYDFFRGIVDNFNYVNVRIKELIGLESAIFGFIPTLKLQEFIYQGYATWFDYLMLIFYSSHFYFPVLAAFYIWQKSRPLFAKFVAGFMLLNLMGFITFLLFPSAPPWLASKLGYLPGVVHILPEVLGIRTYTLFYNLIDPNIIAAMPSLHSAWPLFIALFLIYYFRHRYIYFILVLPPGVWLSVVYFGEHYVIDVLLGVVYALIAILLTICLPLKKQTKVVQ